MSRKEQAFSQRVGRAAIVVLLLPFVLPLALIAFALHFLYRIVLYLLVWMVWLPRGKNILFVYSDSPIWHEYMTTQVLPLVHKRAVVLNWSERKKWPWWSLAIALFHHFGGNRDFNPLVLHFQPFRQVKMFRFWPAFMDWKRGYTESVESLRQELVAVL